MRALGLVLALIVLAPGAAGSFPAEPEGAAAATLPRVVVAVVDTGINPYHDVFHAAGAAPESVVAEFGVAPERRLTLTRTGDLAADVAADAARWESVEAGEIVHVEGTRVFAVSVGGDGPRRILDDDGHGTAVAAAVLAANPDAVLLVVEGLDSASVAFAGEHPAVDVVSTSFGPLFSIPTRGIAEATREAVLERGKLHVGAADNSPAAAPVDSTAGPWWSIGVSGFDDDASRGRGILSGSFPDFAADHRQRLARHDDESALVAMEGTSFATPRVAGYASAVLLAARDAAGHAGGIRDGRLVDAGGYALNAWHLRAALNLTAAAPAPAEWDAFRGLATLTAPAPAPAHAALVGWGVVNGTILKNAVPQFMHGGPALRDATTATLMEESFAARRAYWGD